MREFAEREGLCVGSLYRWIADARAEEEVPARVQEHGDEGRPAFVEVRHIEGSRDVAWGRVGMELPGGVRVEVTTADPARFVASLARALREEGSA